MYRVTSYFQSTVLEFVWLDKHQFYTLQLNTTQCKIPEFETPPFVTPQFYHISFAETPVSERLSSVHTRLETRWSQL